MTQTIATPENLNLTADETVLWDAAIAIIGNTYPQRNPCRECVCFFSAHGEPYSITLDEVLAIGAKSH